MLTSKSIAHSWLVNKRRKLVKLTLYLYNVSTGSGGGANSFPKICMSCWCMFLIMSRKLVYVMSFHQHAQQACISATFAAVLAPVQVTVVVWWLSYLWRRGFTYWKWKGGLPSWNCRSVWVVWVLNIIRHLHCGWVMQLNRIKTLTLSLQFTVEWSGVQ